MRHLIATALLAVLFVTAGFAQTWNYKEDTERYALQIADTESLDSIRFFANNEFFGTSYYVGGEYISYWKIPNAPEGVYDVYADMYYGAVSADTLGRSFTTQVQIPGQVGLIDPPDGSINVSVDVTLVWAATPYAEYYQLQLSTDQFYSDTLLDVQTPDTTYYVEGLQHNTTYYWRVRAGNESGWGDWSGNF